MTNPGSAIISSDAAKALNIVQNEQTKVQIVAVRVPEHLFFRIKLIGKFLFVLNYSH